MDKLSFFILNIFLNSLLVFFTAIILIEILLFLFRIRPGRIAAYLRMIPILKLPLDLLLYDFSRWSYLQGINPLHCEEGTRTLSVLFCWMSPSTHWGCFPISSEIQFSVPGNLTFTLADTIGYLTKPYYLEIFAILLLACSSYFVVRKLILYYVSKNILSKIINNSRPITQKIHNPALIRFFKKSKSQILVSSTLFGSPFVTGILSPTIFIPSDLAKGLSHKEYEAVLAHEIEHIRHKDVFLRYLLDVISSVFWWVPTKWLKNRIEEGQEIGCDEKCRKYGIDAVDLASALCKCAKNSKNNTSQVFAYHLVQHKALTRIKVLVQPYSKKFYKIQLIFGSFVLGVSFFLILFGRFWIF